ncbi:MAG: putative sodium/proton antiporter [Frankiales bacterium]|nr:putative sodium/proton antiporter [Frankiales bacterium]
MADVEPQGRADRTTWWRRDTPLRHYLSTETASAAILLAATLTALVWVNIDASSYQDVWRTNLSVRLGQWAVAMDVRTWINSGLMAFFFFVIGLEARREFDLGELRDRPRVVLPLLAGVAGMVGAVAVYLAFNVGRPSAHGWGVAMSTDTAFALGVLAVVGRGVPDRLRGFMLTVVVVDDIVALIVIATVYTSDFTLGPVLIAVALFAVAVVCVRLRIHGGLLYLALSTAGWVALFKSGVDPIVMGLAAGLITYAAPASRTDLERATGLFRDFREQPTPELAQSARAGLRAALSPNDRLQQLFHPWTSYVIVPLFALANAGVSIDMSFLSHAYGSPITLGIVAGYVIGKPVGVFVTSSLITKMTRGRLRPPVGWAAVLGGGTLAGIGFTVSLLIASLAFTGTELEEAKLGILTAAVASALLTGSLFFVTSRLPKPVRTRALLGRSEILIDLADPVDVERDHIRGPLDAPVTLVEYGDFECPYCGQAEPVVRELLTDFGDLRYVWRHLPLNDVHPSAQIAAEAAEAAAAQGAFWELHRLMLDHQGELRPKDLLRYAESLGLDTDRFMEDLRTHRWSDRVSADVESADVSGVAGTPSFFVNGQRHVGAYDIDTLSNAVRTARARAAIPVR